MSTSYLMQANLGIGQISVANSNLDGSGTIVPCFTAATAAGTREGGSIITSIKIKATSSITSQGMVRLFIYDGTSFYLFKEIAVRPTTQSSVLPSFKVYMPSKLRLDSGYQIYATTENSDPFNIFVSGYNYGACECGTMNSFPSIISNENMGLVTINTANPNIDGTGTLGTLLNSISSGAGPNIGTVVTRITIKAEQTTTQGMVRLYISDGTTTYLWGEVMIPAVTQSGVIQTFAKNFPANLMLNPDYVMYASTENAETFNLVAIAQDFTCCKCGQ